MMLQLIQGFNQSRDNSILLAGQLPYLKLINVK